MMRVAVWLLALVVFIVVCALHSWTASINIPVIANGYLPRDVDLLREVFAELGLHEEQKSLNPCGERGVICKSGRVLEIRLDGRGLHGTIPACIGNLSGLQKLVLSNNKFSGHIPSELGQLTSLQGLWLNDNALKGPVPASLGRLRKLRELVMYANSLQGEIPASLGKLSQLRLLMLDRNALNGTVPAALFRLSHLEDMLLFSNDLRGFKTSDWRRMNSLRVVMLQDNHNLQGQLPLLPASVEKVDFRGCRLRGTLPNEWTQGLLPRLRALYLSTLPGNSKLLQGWTTWATPPKCHEGRVEGGAGMPALTTLDLSGLQLHCAVDEVLAFFASSPLSTVLLRNTSLGGMLDHRSFHRLYSSGPGASCYHGPGQIYESVAHLDLSHNRVTAVKWELFPYERPPPSLQVLSLAENALVEFDAEWIAPPFVTLTGNPQLQATLPISEEPAACQAFWSQRFNGKRWMSGTPEDPCLRPTLAGAPCHNGLEGFTIPLTSTLQPRRLWIDSISATECTGLSIKPPVNPATHALAVTEPAPRLPKLEVSSSAHGLGPLTGTRASVLRLASTAVTARAAQVAVALGIPDILSSPRGCGELSGMLGVAKEDGGEERLCRLLRALVSMGLVSEDSSGHFIGNEATALLKKEGKDGHSLAAFLKYEPVLHKYMGALQEVVTTGQLGPEVLHGFKGPGALFRVSKEDNALFAEAFKSIETREEAISATPWPDRPFHLCDVAGAEAVDAVLLTSRRPDVHVTILDTQPSDIPTGADNKQITFQVHDMFSPLPSNLQGSCDMFWLDFVVQDFADSAVVSILKHLRAGAPPNARIVLVTHVLGVQGGANAEAERFKHEMDLWQMVAFGGKERSSEDFKSLLVTSGWGFDEVKGMLGEASLVIGTSQLAYASELSQHRSVMPGPFVGQLEVPNPSQSPRAAAFYLEDGKDAASVSVVHADSQNLIRVGTGFDVPDMDFVGIWEMSLPISENISVVMYCSRLARGPCGRIAKLKGKRNHEALMSWLSEPAPFTAPRSHSQEHFFSNRPPVQLPCAMRITSVVLSGGKIVTCYIEEQETPGAICRVAMLIGNDSLHWGDSMYLHKGIMAAACSNLPMHRFATLKVVSAGLSLVALYSDGALVRGGGRCNHDELHSEATCTEGGACNLLARFLKTNKGGVLEASAAFQTPFRKVHMLNTISTGPDSFVACFVAEPLFPKISSQGQCSEAHIADQELHWGDAAIFGSGTLDITMTSVPGDPGRFVVAYEKDHKISVLMGLVQGKQVLFSHIAMPILDSINAQRPSLAALGASMAVLAIADQSSGDRPVLLSVPLNQTRFAL